uniref:Uncharacterized protein n=1 Tax=Kalanchoe fedtschenkoi TaxID=63787 RepID=A0A7N0V247_KALFE
MGVGVGLGEEDDNIVRAAELLVQLSDENSNSNGGGGGDEEEDDGARQVSFPEKAAEMEELDNGVQGRRRRRPRFRSIAEIYAETKPMKNGHANDVVSKCGGRRKKRC